MSGWVRWVLVLVTGMVFGVTTNSPLGLSAPPGNPDKGKSPYEQYCAICHGAKGLGNGPMAKATSPPATRLAGRDVRDKPDQELFDAIANGVGAAMPAWRGILSDEQISDVVAYVRSLAGS